MTSMTPTESDSSGDSSVLTGILMTHGMWQTVVTKWHSVEWTSLALCRSTQSWTVSDTVLTAALCRMTADIRGTMTQCQLSHRWHTATGYDNISLATQCHQLSKHHCKRHSDTVYDNVSLSRRQHKRHSRECHKVPLYCNRHSVTSNHSGVASDTVLPVTVTAVPAALLADDPPVSTCQHTQTWYDYHHHHYSLSAVFCHVAGTLHLHWLHLDQSWADIFSSS